MISQILTRTPWLKVAGAIMTGVFIGILAAASNVSRRSAQPLPATTPVPYIVPVSDTQTYSFQAATQQPDQPGLQADPEQIERLKIRNRRLEALVSVLRQRTAERR